MLAPHMARESNNGLVLHDSFGIPGKWHVKRPKPVKNAPRVPLWQERATRWASGLEAGIWPSRAALAREEGVTRAYITQVLSRLNNAMG